MILSRRREAREKLENKKVEEVKKVVKVDKKKHGDK